MSISSNSSRRRFLTALSGLSAYSFLSPSRVLATCRQLSDSDPLAVKLVALFTHEDSAQMIGQTYLQRVPEEADVHVLVDRICSSQLARRAELLEADTSTLRAWLSQQQRQDFLRGGTVKVQGWMLSATEVRLCALTVLL